MRSEMKQDAHFVGRGLSCLQGRVLLASRNRTNAGLRLHPVRTLACSVADQGLRRCR